MPKINFVVENLQVEVPPGRKLRAVALENGIYVNREWVKGVNCGGRGICGTCNVWVKAPDGAVSPPNLREKLHGMGPSRRLACQTEVRGDIEVTTMPGGDDRLDPNRKIDPATTKNPRKVIAKAEAKAEPKAEAKAEPKVEAKAEPKNEAKAEPKIEAKAEPKIEAKAEPKAEEEPASKEPKVETEARKTDDSAQGDSKASASASQQATDATSV